MGRARAGFAVAVLLSSSRLFAQTPAASDGVDETLPPPPVAPPGTELQPDAAALSGAKSDAAVAGTLEGAADTPSPTAPQPPVAPERAWYGWQLLISDFVALGAIGGAAVAGVGGTDAYAVIIPAAIVYDLGAPTIHWLHQRKAIAGASFGIRAGVPFVGVLVGSVVASCGNEGSAAASCRRFGAGYGALGGFAVATAIDAAFLAWDAPIRSPGDRAVATGLGWTPLLLPRQGGAMLGVIGDF
jgi:hypothetical protein